jgi:alkylhydroperoxidase family enzyme
MSVRIAPIAPPYTDEVAEDFSKLVPPGMEPIGLFRTIAHNPRVLRKLRFGNLLDRGSSITLRQREIVILRTSVLCGAEYEWGVHVSFFAGRAGLTDDCIYASCWLGADAACWQPDEALLIRLCDELHASSRVSDALWAAVRETFSEAQCIELFTLVGFYHSIAFVIHGSGVALEPMGARFPPERARVEPVRHAGSCLCGSIRYEVEGELGDFGFCHCQSCRKASGSAHAANAPVDRAQLTLLDARGTLREFESSPGKLRAFCSACGSPLYAYLRDSPNILRLRLGSLDTDFTKQPRAHTFISDKAAWEPLRDGIPQFAEWAHRDVLHQRGSRQDQLEHGDLPNR